MKTNIEFLTYHFNGYPMSRFDKFVVEHFRDDTRQDDVAIHYIEMPDSNDKGWYISVVSAQAFQSRQLNKHYTHEALVKRGGGLPFGKSFTIDNVRDPAYSHWQRDPNIIKHHHKSIWNFYKFIGYDHKKNKWP